MLAAVMKPTCPVCGKETLEVDPGRFHCGRVRLLSKVQDHYLTFRTLPEIPPKKGCPICGRPMENVGRFRWLTLTPKLGLAAGREDGLERMFCDQSDHYCYVTKQWYELAGRQ